MKRLPLLRPETYDIRENVDATITEYARTDWEAYMRPNVPGLAKLVQQLQSRGCRVVFFELPTVPELRENAYVRVAHRLAHEAFPDRSRWLELSDHELRWVDSSHFDERSAILVTHQIDNYLSTGGGRPN